MKDNLVLFTKTYPFDAGEYFIENEITTLADNFENVIVIATAVSKNSEQTRKVPSNVKVYKFDDIQNLFVRYAYYIIRGLPKCFSGEVFKELRKAPGIKAKLGVLYIAARTDRVTEKSLEISEIRNFFLKSDVLLYTYWFSDLPIVAYKLKKHFQNTSLTIVSRAHGYDLYADRNVTKYIPFRDLVLENVDMVLPCSNNGVQYLINLYPQYSEKIKTSYLGTNDWGMSNAMKTDNYHIVTCSSVIPLKRVKLVAEALNILENDRHITNIKWTCIGDGPLLEELKDYSTNNIHSISVDLMGRLTNAQVIQFYKSHYVDLFINVSESEGLPVSIMEAQSFGVPTLATDVGGTSEIVIDGLTGKLLSKDIDAKTLADALEFVMKREFDRNVVRQFWDEHFNAQNNYEEFIIILGNLKYV